MSWNFTQRRLTAYTDCFLDERKVYLAFSDALVWKLAYQVAGDRTAKLPSVVSRKRNAGSPRCRRGPIPAPQSRERAVRLILGDMEFCNLSRLRTIYSKGRV